MEEYGGVFWGVTGATTHCFDKRIVVWGCLCRGLQYRWHLHPHYKKCSSIGIPIPVIHNVILVFIFLSAFAQAGLNSLEAGDTMDKARFEVGVLLRGLRGSGDVVADDVDAAIVEVLMLGQTG